MLAKCREIWYNYTVRNKKLIALLLVIITIVILVVVLSVVFTVRNVSAHNYVNDNDGYSETVAEASGIKKGSSIFFIDEDGVKKAVSKTLPQIDVITVERKFPDRVTLHYMLREKSFEYFYDGNYYGCYSNGRIGAQSTQSLGVGYFLVKFSGAANTEIGSDFVEKASLQYKRVMNFLSIMHDYGYSDLQMSELFTFVDFTVTDRLYVSMKTGCGIDINGSSENFERNLNIALEAYLSHDSIKSSGVFIIGDTKSYYSPTNASDYYDAHF